MDTTNLTVENIELKTRVVKLEQKQSQTDDDAKGITSNISDNTSNSDVAPEQIDNSSEPKSLEDKEIDNFLVKRHSEQISNEIRERNREKKLQAQDLSSVNTSKLPDDLIIKLDKNLITEWELKQQLSMSISIPIASDQLRDQDSSSVTAESIVYIFYKAIQSGQEGIRYWYYFIEKYDKKIDEVVISGVKRKTATSMVYQEIKELLSDITNVNSHQKILRARKIYKLFNTIGIEKIKQVSYSTDAVSSLSYQQIQNIIDYVISKTVKNSSQSEVSEVPTFQSKKILSKKQNNPAHDHETKSLAKRMAVEIPHLFLAATSPFFQIGPLFILPNWTMDCLFN
ncbi:10855_t:CDS:2, partial [Entrophospora sp. SA101]